MGDSTGTPSSVSSLPPPLGPLIHSSEQGNDSQEETDYPAIEVDQLTLEVKLQFVVERMEILEAGHANILEMQKLILKTQEGILSRLAALEKRGYGYQTPLSPFEYPQEELSFEETDSVAA